MRSQLHHILAETAAWRPEGPALTFKATTLTYRELWQRSAAWAPGSRASASDGATASPSTWTSGSRPWSPSSPPRSPEASSSPSTRCCGPARSATSSTTAALGCWSPSADRFDQLEDQLADCKTIERVVLVGDGRRARPGARYEIVEWATVASSGAEPAEAGAVDLDMAAILYTSGSTGRPKGVVLSHRNLIVGAESVSHYLAND